MNKDNFHERTDQITHKIKIKYRKQKKSKSSQERAPNLASFLKIYYAQKLKPTPKSNSTQKTPKDYI